MTETLTLQLLQFIALALPAIGIFAAFAMETRTSHRAELGLDPDATNPYISSPLGHTYHGMRVAILFLLFAGVSLFTHLLMILPPNWRFPFFDSAIDNILEPAILGIGILFTMAGLIVFGMSIAFQQIALRDKLGILASLRLLFIGQPQGVKKRIGQSLNRAETGGTVEGEREGEKEPGE